MKKSFNKLLFLLVGFKYFLPPDVYERHKFIGKFVPAGSNILDVGGSMSKLPNFTTNCKVTTADVVKPADIIYNGHKIPVDDKSFDVVTSIDVMEHIKSENRDEFVKELNRVAKNKVIISAPLGTDYHLEYEKRMLKYYQNNHVKLPFLEEHVAIGIPKPAQVESFAKKYKGKIYYSGDTRFTNTLFRIHNYESKNKYLNLITFFLKLKFNFWMNVLGYYLLVNKKQTKYTNRFYLIFDKR